MNLKRELFDLYDNVRIIWNDIYRINRNYNKEDLQKLEKLIELVEHDSKEIKEMIKNEYND